MNPERQPKPLPEEEPQSWEPEALMKYVQEHEELPNITDEELVLLNERMTQEEILAYYVVLDTMEDRAKRQEALDRWIPKPKIMYHASRAAGVEEFEPRNRYKRQPGDPPMVYGAPDKRVAAMMLGPGGDEWSRSGSYDGGKTWTYIFTDTPEFHAADTGGYIYELPPDTFTTDPDIGMRLSEWTSTKPVKPVGEPAQYESGIQAMLQHGVQVYAVTDEVFARFRDPQQDQIELLKELQPLK